MASSKMLELRKKMKLKKPVFIRQNYEKRKRLHHKVWRKPKGLHSKMRHHIRGRRSSPSVGYKSPVEARCLHPSGLKQVVVHNLKEIPSSKEYGIIIAGNVGKRKKVDIIKKAIESGIKILEIDAELFMKKVEEDMKRRKENRSTISKMVKQPEGKKQKSEESEKKKEKPSGAAESSKEIEDKKKEEEKREKDKREKDKLLIKKV